MEVKNIHISRKEFRQFRDLQLRLRKDWHAVFSVNKREDIWPFVCWGLTPQRERKYIAKQECRLLHEIAGVLLENFDEDGGRFFIDEHGVFWTKETERNAVNRKQFVSWKPDEPLVDKRTAPISKVPTQKEIYEAMQARMKAARGLKNR